MEKMQIKISEESMAELRSWFANYTGKFQSDYPEMRQNLDLKRDHTRRVCDEMSYLGRCSRLTEDELRLAEAIALLHDIGRFEQYARYGTFVDGKSENHAELGIKIIEKYGVLDSFDDAAKDIAMRAVRYHNRPSLPPDETDTVLLFAKLTRDADKLDIWKVVTDYYHRKEKSRNASVELDLPDTPGFSREVYLCLMQKRIVNIKDVKNLNDFKLLQIGWVFDLNFDATLRRVKERRYLELIRNVLPESREIDDLFNRHLSGHLKIAF